MRAPRTLFTVLVTVSLLGCRATAPPPADGPVAPEAVRVVVSNMNWARIVVYAVASGQSYWLGVVETGRTETMNLPARLLSSLDLYLSVQTIGARTEWRTDLLVLTEGDTLELTVENNLELSHYLLYE